MKHRGQSTGCCPGRSWLRRWWGYTSVMWCSRFIPYRVAATMRSGAFFSCCFNPPSIRPHSLPSMRIEFVLQFWRRPWQRPQATPAFLGRLAEPESDDIRFTQQLPSSASAGSGRSPNTWRARVLLLRGPRVIVNAQSSSPTTPRSLERRKERSCTNSCSEPPAHVSGTRTGTMCRWKRWPNHATTLRVNARQLSIWRLAPFEPHAG